MICLALRFKKRYETGNIHQRHREHGNDHEPYGELRQQRLAICLLAGCGGVACTIATNQRQIDRAGDGRHQLLHKGAIEKGQGRAQLS